MHHHSSERGIALLITLLIMTVLLGVSSSLLNITIKQFQFSSIGLASEMSFQAANAGMECLLAHDYETYTSTNPVSKFDVGQSSPSISCMGSANTTGFPEISTAIRSERRYQFTWGTPAVCSDITIYKFYDPTSSQDISLVLRRPLGTVFCATGVTCTVIQSRGYNVACNAINTPRTIERELTQRY